MLQVVEDFVQYLKEWKAAVANREGFSKVEKEKMFLTLQTYEGIVTTGENYVKNI